MNSRAKGARGERQWRDVLRAHGCHARRGQQFCGSPDSPDVVCDELKDFHFEVKVVERLNIQDAMAQAKRDCGNKVPIVVHRRNHYPWLATVPAEILIPILLGDLPAGPAGGEAEGDPPQTGGLDGEGI